MATLFLIFQIWHLSFAGLGAFLNVFLLLLAIFKSPKAIKLYSTLIINFAITDLFACILDMFVEIRLLPSPGEATMTYILNGFCVQFGLTACSVGLSLFIHTLTHSLWSLLISFAYRYYVLFSPTIKRRDIVLVLFAFYCPSLLQGLTYWMNFVDRATILPIAQRVYPEYKFDEESGLLTGITNLFSVSAIYALFHMLVPVTPIYMTIFILRRRIMKTLMKSHNSMSKETKAVHRQLLKSLTCQSLIPMAAWIGVYVYLAMQFGLIRGVLFEYLIFSSVIFLPVLSPVTYLVFVRPYRKFCSRLMCRNSESVEEQSKTRFYSNMDVSTANSRKS